MDLVTLSHLVVFPPVVFVCSESRSEQDFFPKKDEKGSLLGHFCGAQSPHECPSFEGALRQAQREYEQLFVIDYPEVLAILRISNIILFIVSAASSNGQVILISS
jgi:hypothetical protein